MRRMFHVKHPTRRVERSISSADYPFIHTLFLTKYNKGCKVWLVETPTPTVLLVSLVQVQAASPAACTAFWVRTGCGAVLILQRTRSFRMKRSALAPHLRLRGNRHLGFRSAMSPQSRRACCTACRSSRRLPFPLSSVCRFCVKYPVAASGWL